jgi:hypothetical protein
MTYQPVPAEFKGQVLTPAQIAQWAVQAGFKGNDLAVAVAIAMAESSGHIDAKNINIDGSTDLGIWQINTVHADLLARYPQWWSVENADMAFSLYQSKGGKFTDWVTYNTGAYQLYMSQAKQAAASPDTGNVIGGPGDTKTVNVIPGVDSIASSLSAFATGFAAVAQWMGDVHNWERVGLVLIGGALVVGALVMVAGESVSGPVEKVTGKVLRAAAV